MFVTLRKKINYWYFRYLLITELYMVEKWERTMFHIVFLILFGLVFVFNRIFTLGVVSYATNYMFQEASENNTPDPRIKVDL